MIDFKDILLVEKQQKKVKDMTPEEKEAYDIQSAKNKAAAEKFHSKHPVHMKNIVKHYNLATDNEKENGMSWYEDDREAAKPLAKSSGITNHAMAGLIATYSPQTQWDTNFRTAARVARTKVAIGGPNQKVEDGEKKVFADGRQKENAQRILNGEHYDDVLSGHKVRAFAHLIEHGGSADPANPRVCVDRHAHSVASGARLNDNAFHYAGLNGKAKYESVQKAYVDAATHISKKTGTTVLPHQLQAITWLTRQRLNGAESAKMAGKEKTAKGNNTGLHEYLDEFHPGMDKTHIPKTGHTLEGFENSFIGKYL